MGDFFGGTDSSAQDLTLKQNQDTLDLIERQTQRATRDVSKLFGSAEQNLLAGNQAAMDMVGQFAPQQFSALQQGNLGAQEQLLAGMPQVQNALLGLPTDLSGFQPRQAQVDTSFLQNPQLPQFQTSQQALGLNAPEVRQEQQFDIDAELARLPHFSPGNKFELMQRTPELAEAIQGLSPEAKAQLIERGAGQVGLGGNTGTSMFNRALSGDTSNPFGDLNKLGSKL